MIANAVPSPLAEAIGRVILGRENGRTIPEVEGRFVNWMMEAGRSPQSARNVKSQVNRARRLLSGRTFFDTGLELARLELNAEFETLTVRTRSDLRAALRLYAEYLDRKGKAARSRIAKISRMAA